MIHPIRKNYLLVFLLALSMLYACQSEKAPGQDHAGNFDESVYLEKGKAIASASFAALSVQLQAAMQEGGLPKAVEYCQLQAYSLTDSLSELHQATIRRTSLQVRNPLNLPNDREKAVLEEYAHGVEQGKPLAPIVAALDEGQIAFYAPIKVNAFCLQCHGKVGESLREADYGVIKERYPDDQATGYQDGDLRGMWSIRFR